ncbi:TraR/DksA family transcriptional regulator [Shewanella spartinae]|uniref:TraR/DksA family transcriptional regulator n=1 Tax=Shewanella spartinae TaxID=2864205 RepID=UPI001C657A77|nr:TraR/DksA C4-type zinc finger protein [Shewanella spartinae]QYJ92313.1 TraR/DksA C4-type zinc finger protein [Shewanella spartinae]
MSRSHIRHELSVLEANLRKELGTLLALHQITLDTQQLSLTSLIDEMTAAKLTDEPLFIKLTQLDAALCQLDLGLYGLCSDCEADIEAERLNANPLEQRCTQCAADYAHEHRHELRLTH